MFCRNCGARIADAAAFCPSCGTKAVRQPSSAPFAATQGRLVQTRRHNHTVGATPAHTYLEKGTAAVAALIFGALALVCFVCILGNVEPAVAAFTPYDAITSALGTFGFVICGALLTTSAALAASPLAHGVFDTAALNRANATRSLAIGGAFLAMCVAVWICARVFNSPAGGDVPSILYFIFRTFGETAVTCIVPTIAALIILHVLRTRLLAARAS